MAKGRGKGGEDEAVECAICCGGCCFITFLIWGSILVAANETPYYHDLEAREGPQGYDLTEKWVQDVCFVRNKTIDFVRTITENDDGGTTTTDYWRPILEVYPRSCGSHSTACLRKAYNSPATAARIYHRWTQQKSECHEFLDPFVIGHSYKCFMDPDDSTHIAMTTRNLYWSNYATGVWMLLIVLSPFEFLVVGAILYALALCFVDVCVPCLSEMNEARREAHWFEHEAPPPPTVIELSRDRSHDFVRAAEVRTEAAVAMAQTVNARMGARANSARGLLQRSFSRNILENRQQTPANPPGPATSGSSDSIAHAFDLAITMVKDATGAKEYKAGISCIEKTLRNNQIKPSDYEQLNMKVLIPLAQEKKEELGPDVYDSSCSKALTGLFQLILKKQSAAERGLDGSPALPTAV